MEKQIVYACILSLAAGIVVAEEKSLWWKLGFGDDAKEQVGQQAPQRPSHGRGRDRSDMQYRRQKVGEEQRAKMKAHFEELRKLGQAARNEADPVKKEALISELRGKLTAGAERMQVEFRKRVEKAEADIVKMRKRLEEGEKNLSNRVEGHLKRILSGEPPQRGKGGREGMGDGPLPGRKDPPPTE